MSRRYFDTSLSTINGYDAWKTQAPEEERAAPCARCRKHEPEPGSSMCDDCLENERLEELAGTICMECTGRGRPGCTCGYVAHRAKRALATTGERG